jgi:hypothetical protein
MSPRLSFFYLKITHQINSLSTDDKTSIFQTLSALKPENSGNMYAAVKTQNSSLKIPFSN